MHDGIKQYGKCSRRTSMFENDEFFKYEEFNWLRLNKRSVIARELLALPGVNYDLTIKEGGPVEWMNDQMIMDLNARILGKELPSFIVTEHKPFNMPKNPWQHFKDMYADKWFMRWLVTRWPVKFITTKVTLTAEWKQWATYPWLDGVPVSPKWQPVRVMFPARTRLELSDFNGESEKSES